VTVVYLPYRDYVKILSSFWDLVRLVFTSVHERGKVTDALFSATTAGGGHSKTQHNGHSSKDVHNRQLSPVALIKIVVH
jgi:hypothetical protein